jgi:hypothetical protein
MGQRERGMNPIVSRDSEYDTPDLGGLHLWLGDYWHSVLITTASYRFAWLLLAYLYRQRLFRRI